MLIGLLADSHDRVPTLRAFARQFADRGVSMILHAGDMCSPFALEALLEIQIPLVGVFGRNDGDHRGLHAAASSGMAELYEAPHSVELSERRILLLHDLADTQDRSVDGHDIVVHGGTHKAEMRNRGTTLIVNPGEACGWVYGTPSAALLHLTTRKVEILSLPEGE
jgi:uncharacterized protein